MLKQIKGNTKKGIALALVLSSMFAFAGCGSKQHQGSGEVVVKTMNVIRRDTPNVFEFTGFVEADKEAKLVSQVSGQIMARHFKGGDTVQEGQSLFTIDQRTYQANLLNAKAGLANARAEYHRLNKDAERYSMLLEKNAVSRQMYDQIIAQRDQAAASVSANEAMVINAEVAMGETEVRAPFTGRIDTTDLSVGNYVVQGQTLLATISNTDPVRVKFSMSENEYLNLSKAKSTGGSAAFDNLSLILSDGSVYPTKGVVDQFDRGVSEGTGTITLKARFNNPDRLLLPGMFARVNADSGITKDAILIPQRAVKEMLYKTFVYTVDGENKVDMKEVKLGARVGRLWLVESGLEGNETIVVEGVQKVNKGTAVKPTTITEADLSTDRTAADEKAN